jgi:hypothetical protein
MACLNGPALLHYYIDPDLAAWSVAPAAALTWMLVRASLRRVVR